MRILRYQLSTAVLELTMSVCKALAVSMWRQITGPSPEGVGNDTASGAAARRLGRRRLGGAEERRPLPSAARDGPPPRRRLARRSFASIAQ